MIPGNRKERMDWRSEVGKEEEQEKRASSRDFWELCRKPPRIIHLEDGQAMRMTQGPPALIEGCPQGWNTILLLGCTGRVGGLGDAHVQMWKSVGHPGEGRHHPLKVSRVMAELRDGPGWWDSTPAMSNAYYRLLLEAVACQGEVGNIAEKIWAWRLDNPFTYEILNSLSSYLATNKCVRLATL